MLSDYITSVDEEDTNIEVKVVPYSSSTALTLALSQHERQNIVKSDDNNKDKPLKIKNTPSAMAWSAVFENDMSEALEEKDANCKDSTDYKVQRKSKSFMSFWRKNKKRGKKQFQELEDNEEKEGEVYETETISSLWDNDQNNITTEILNPHARERKSLELDSLFSAALVHAKESEVKRKKQNQQHKSRNSTPQLIEEDAEIKDYDDLNTLFSEALAQAKKKEAGKLNEFKSHGARGGENDSNVKDHVCKESKEPFCRILNEDFECDLKTVAFGEDENPSDSESSLNAILGRLTPKKSPRDYDHIFSELQSEMKQTKTGNEKQEDNLESTTTTTLKVTERKRNKPRRKKKKKGDNSEHFVDVKPEAIILDLMDMNDFSDDDRVSDKYMNFEEHETMSSQRSVGLNPFSDQVSTISPPSIVRKNPDESSCFNGAEKKNLFMSQSFDQYRKNVRDAAKWKIARQRYKSTLQSSLGIQDEVIMEDNLCVGITETTEDLINDTCQAIKGTMISGDANLKSYKITRRTSSRSTKKISNATFDEDTEAMSSMMTGSSFMLPENSSNDDVHVNEDEDESNDDAVKKSSFGFIYSDDESDENCPEEKYLIPSD